MIPLCLVTGFLGAGKTTLLKRIVATHRDRRFVYLVNEFSPLDIDGALVGAEYPEVVAIPGGSIFCRCLVTEFIGRLRRIREQFGAVEGVIIEASGTADPAVIADLLVETGLGREYELARVVCVVEPRSFLRLIHTLPNIIRQTQAADLVLLNKCDLFDEATLAQTESELRRIKPDVQVVRCVRCEADFPLFPAASPERNLHGEYAQCRDPHYAAFSLVPAGPVDVAALEAFLAANQESVFRVKGYLPTADGPVYFDYSPAGVRVEPAADSPPRFGLAWICHGAEAAERIQRDAAALLAPGA